MGYGYVYVQNAVLGQLNAINKQMWAQWAEAEKQQRLSDLLLSLNKSVDRAYRTSFHDPLAAGVLALRCINSVAWLNSSWFSDYDRKARFEQCCAALAHHRDRLYADPALTNKATVYMQIEDREIALHAQLGDDPSRWTALAVAKSEKLQTQKRNVWIVAAVMAFGSLTLPWIILAVDEENNAMAITVFCILCGIGLAALIGLTAGPSGDDRRAATIYAASMTRALAEWNALLVSEPGLPFLTRSRQEHPYLVAEAPYAPPPTEVARVEKQVETQVVVARCKYCSQLTPVDMKRCRVCGADSPH